MIRKLALAATLLLSACSTLQPPPTPVGNLKGTLGEHWSFNGKAGIRQGDHANSATIDWLQQQEQFNIRLSGPLGQGGAQIDGGPAGVTLAVAGEEEPYRAATAEAVMQQALGWQLPVSQARYWVQGRPDPAYSYEPLADAPGFEQLGWRVEIQRLMPVGDSLVLPSRLQFNYADLRIRLVIHQWEPDN